MKGLVSVAGIIAFSLFAGDQVASQAQPVVPALTVTSFADDTFFDADWTVAQPPGLLSVQKLKAANASAGGHPDAFWSLQAVLPTNATAGMQFSVAHLLKGYSFDPAEEGEVVGIDGGYDLLSRNPNTSAALLLLQDGSYFIGPVDMAPLKVWSSFGRAGLKATDFVRLVPARRAHPGSPHPDFSCRGKPIQVGIVTHLIKSKGTELSAGIDNWFIRFSARCCPAATGGERENDGSISVRRPSGTPASGNPAARPARRQCCDDEEATTDANGIVILPDDVDTATATPPVFEYIDQEVGEVKELYSGIDPGLDTWYLSYPCKQACGGSAPKEATQPPDFEAALQEIGIKDKTSDQIGERLREWDTVIAALDRKLYEVDWSVRTAPEYTPPAAPHRPRPGVKYAFGGRDIIFVHGLKLEHLADKAAGKSEAQVKWKQPDSFPADSLNPEFYSGYFKRRATLTWNANLDPAKEGGHIREFLHGGPDGTKPKYMNRYLIVSYSCNERLDVAVKSVLAQIGDAMRFGIGVVDPLNPNGPPPKDFGTPSFVVISHSTGGEVMDVAFTAAAQHPSLGAEYIPKHCKAHIAVQGAHRGSRYASAGIALSWVAASDPNYPWVWNLVQETFGGMDDWLMSPLSSSVFATAGTSILMDLVPLVAQERWGRYVRETPVRTLTVVGAHPTFLRPAKNLLLLGLDDGVLTVESQLANPNDVRLAPSGFVTGLAGLVRNFDLGVFGQADTVQASINGILASYSVQFTATGLDSPHRALSYYVNQKGERALNPANLIAFPPPPSFFASGALPWISPTGMLLTVDDYYASGSGEVPLSASPLNRNPLHFSYLQSTADHFKGTHDQVFGFNGLAYANTLVAPGELNLEETRAITDPRVFEPYPMQYSGDNQPLLRLENVPPLVERIRGLRVTFTVQSKLFKKKKWTRSIWVWKRTYHLLKDWEAKRQFDYIYESVLKN